MTMAYISNAPGGESREIKLEEKVNIHNVLYSKLRALLFAVLVICGFSAALTVLCGLGLAACMAALQIVLLATSSKPAAILIMLPFAALVGWLLWLHRSVHTWLAQP